MSGVINSGDATTHVVPKPKLNKFDTVLYWFANIMMVVSLVLWLVSVFFIHDEQAESNWLTSYLVFSVVSFMTRLDRLEKANGWFR